MTSPACGTFTTLKVATLWRAVEEARSTNPEDIRKRLLAAYGPEYLRVVDDLVIAILDGLVKRAMREDIVVGGGLCALLLTVLENGQGTLGAHKSNAQALDLELRDVRAESRRLESLVAEHKATAEELADRLHQEQLAHELTRKALVEERAARERAEAERDRLWEESWAAAVQVAEVRELLEAESFSADVLRMSKDLAEQYRVRAEQAERALADVQQDIDANAHEMESLLSSLRQAERERDEARRLHGKAVLDGSAAVSRAERMEAAARLVLGVCDTPTTQEQQEARLAELDGALTALRAALPGEEVAHG